MSTVTFHPSRLRGRASVPPSKSEAHRALILAALGRGECLLKGFGAAVSDDIEATLDGVRALGAETRREDNAIRVLPSRARAGAKCDARACAAALRMLIPAFLVRGVRAEIAMDDALYGRPLDAYVPLARRLKATLDIKPPKNGARACAIVDGVMPAGDYEIDGSVSSQYASGMLMALAHATDGLKPAPSRLTVGAPIVSRPYIDMTLALMSRFGIACVESDEGVFELTPCGEPSPESITPGGDWSQAAALLCANALGGGVMLEGMSMDDDCGAQGDARILDILTRMGMRAVYSHGALYAVTPSRDALSPIDADCSDIPDIAPLIALVCARARGRSTLTGIGRLRVKECDRLDATLELLHRMGAGTQESGDGLAIYGGAPLRGGFTFNARGDHRMVMLAAIAALAADAPIAVEGAEAVSKSWPDFIDVYASLGGVIG